MKSRFPLFALLAAATLLLAGCRFVVDTRVNADGSGEMRSEVVYTAQEVASFKESPENSGKSICDSLNSSLPAGDSTPFVEEQHGEETYCVSAQPFAKLSDLRLKYALMDGVTVNRLEIQGGQFVFDVDIDTPATGPNGQAPIPTEWRLTPPGTLGRHNAERVDGQSLIWALVPGQKSNLHAESSVGFFNTGTYVLIGLVIVACLCVLALVGGVAAFFLWRRQRSLPPRVPAA